MSAAASLPAETAERPASVPPFTLAGVTWRCWVVEDGQRYEWRAEGRPLAVTRRGRAWRWAAAGGRWSEREHVRLVDAMAAAQLASPAGQEVRS